MFAEKTRNYAIAMQTSAFEVCGFSSVADFSGGRVVKATASLRNE
jgi:hypothetical protein